MTDHLARINEAASRIAALETLMTWPDQSVARWVLAAGEHLPESDLPAVLRDDPVKFPAEHMPWLAKEMAARIDAMLAEILAAERARQLATTGEFFDHLAGATPADPGAAARESVEGACPAEDIGATFPPTDHGGTTWPPVMTELQAARAAERREAEHTREMCS